MQSLGWAEVQIIAVVVLMVALPAGVVVYLLRLARQMRDEQAQLSSRIAELESTRNAGTAGARRRSDGPTGAE